MHANRCTCHCSAFAYFCNQLFSKLMDVEKSSHPIVACALEIYGLCYQFSWIKNICDSRVVAWVLQKGQGVTASCRARTIQVVGRIFTLSQEHGFLPEASKMGPFTQEWALMSFLDFWGSNCQQMLSFCSSYRSCITGYDLW